RRRSDGLSELRDHGYIAWELNRQKRWFRVHRVVYSTDDERFWDGQSVAPVRNRSVAPVRNSSVKSVADLSKISCGFGQNQLRPHPKMSSENNDLQNVTIVRTIEDKKEGKNKFSDGRDCPHPHSHTPLA